MTDAAIPLLETKLHAPRRRRGMVPRPRLREPLDRLDQAARALARCRAMVLPVLFRLLPLWLCVLLVLLVPLALVPALRQFDFQSVPTNVWKIVGLSLASILALYFLGRWLARPSRLRGLARSRSLRRLARPHGLRRRLARPVDHLLSIVFSTRHGTSPGRARPHDRRCNIYASSTSRYIRSTTSIPSRCSPCFNVRAVRSHNNKRLLRSSSVSAFSTGQFSKKSLYRLANWNRYDVRWFGR